MPLLKQFDCALSPTGRHSGFKESKTPTYQLLAYVTNDDKRCCWCGASVRINRQSDQRGLYSTRLLIEETP